RGHRRPRRRPGGALQRRHPRRGARRLRGLTPTFREAAAPVPAAPTRRAHPDPPPAHGPRLIYERMFVLGIDPGLSRCGYGLVARAEGTSALRAHAAGVV